MTSNQTIECTLEQYLSAIGQDAPSPIDIRIPPPSRARNHSSDMRETSHMSLSRAIRLTGSFAARRAFDNKRIFEARDTDDGPAADRYHLESQLVADEDGTIQPLWAILASNRKRRTPKTSKTVLSIPDEYVNTRVSDDLPPAKRAMYQEHARANWAAKAELPWLCREVRQMRYPVDVVYVPVAGPDASIMPLESMSYGLKAWQVDRIKRGVYARPIVPPVAR